MSFHSLDIKHVFWHHYTASSERDLYYLRHNISFNQLHSPDSNAFNYKYHEQ